MKSTNWTRARYNELESQKNRVKGRDYYRLEGMLMALREVLEE